MCLCLPTNKTPKLWFWKLAMLTTTVLKGKKKGFCKLVFKVLLDF